MVKATSIGFVAALLLTGVGCASGDSVVGDWEADKKFEGERSTMSIDEGEDGNGAGKAKVRGAVYDDYGNAALAVVTYSLRWSKVSEDHYDIELECERFTLPDYDFSSSDCGEADAEIECNVVEDGQTLKCDGDLELDWRKAQ